jgi:hypothetical protein
MFDDADEDAAADDVGQTLAMTWQRRGSVTSFNYILKLTIRTTILTRAFS